MTSELDHKILRLAEMMESEGWKVLTDEINDSINSAEASILSLGVIATEADKFEYNRLVSLVQACKMLLLIPENKIYTLNELRKEQEQE